MNHETTSIGSLLKPLPAKRVFEEMADQIKGLIFSGKLIPGNRLPTERDLAVQFGTGRMAVREALRILEQSGLIQIKKGPGGGAFVRDVDPAMASQSVSDAIIRSNMSLQDLVAVRIVLEDLIAELAVEKYDTGRIGTALQGHRGSRRHTRRTRKKTRRRAGHRANERG